MWPATVFWGEMTTGDSTRSKSANPQRVVRLLPIAWDRARDWFRFVARFGLAPYRASNCPVWIDNELGCHFVGEGPWPRIQISSVISYLYDHIALHVIETDRRHRRISRSPNVRLVYDVALQYTRGRHRSNAENDFGSPVPTQLALLGESFDVGSAFVT